MSAPTSTNPRALADRLHRIQDDVAQIAAIAQAEAAIRPAVEGDAGEVLTLTQAAKLLGRSRSWVHEQVQRGVIRAVRIGSRWWLRRADLVADGWLGEPR